MKKSILTRENLNETSIRHNRANSTFINLTNFRNSNDTLNLSKSGINAIFVRSTNLDMAHTIGLINSDCSTGIFLHLLDNLSTRPNDSANEFLRNIQSFNTWNLWFHFLTWFCNRISQLTQDMFTASLCLKQSLFENFERKTAALDIHLSSRKTIFC